MRNLYNFDRLIQAIKIEIVAHTDKSDGMTIKDISYGNDECDSIGIDLSDDFQDRIQIYLPSFYNDDFNSFAVQLFVKDEFITDETCSDIFNVGAIVARLFEKYEEHKPYFTFEGTAIRNPFFNETGSKSVNPFHHYGEDFINALQDDVYRESQLKGFEENMGITITIDDSSDRTIYSFRNVIGQLTGLNYNQESGFIDYSNFQDPCPELLTIIEMMNEGDNDWLSDEQFIKRACDIHATIVTGSCWYGND